MLAYTLINSIYSAINIIHLTGSCGYIIFVKKYTYRLFFRILPVDIL